MNDRDTSLQVRKAGPGDWPAAKQLLQAAGLPVDDLGADSLEKFLVAETGESSGDGIAGLIGIELFGEVGLLRSLVVADSHRRKGIGDTLVAALENAARGEGVRDLWLLTIDADPYFERLGFTAKSRDVAPEQIRSTREFSELCPGDAVLMRKLIGVDAG